MVVVVEPHADPFAFYDPETCECVLAEWYKQSIRAAIPAGREPTELFWLVATDIASKFRIMEKCRAARRSSAADIKRWQRIARLAPGSAEVRTLADIQISGRLAFQGDFNRKYNRNNDLLYIWILEELWCRGLGQKLAISLNKNATPGPLIKFFLACVNPLINKPLTANAVVSIIRKRREERRKVREKNVRAQSA
jgi:hypothetical protein